MNYLLRLLAAVLLLGSFACQSQKQQNPAPTNGETIVLEGAEDGDNQSKREAWFELMHQAAPGTDWRKLEYETQMARHLDRVNNSQQRDGEEILANGQLVGEWVEKGSRNQAGSVIATDYDPQTDEIFLISAGGTLWKGPRSGNAWEVVNQDFQFDSDFLKFVSTTSGRRLIAKINALPHYSDDDGQTWTAATGIPADAGASSRKVTIRPSNQHIYMLSKKDYWSNYRIFYSDDLGETYQPIGLTLGNSNLNRYDICQPHNTDEVYLFSQISSTHTRLIEITPDQSLQTITDNPNFGLGSSVRASVSGIQIDDVLTFYVYGSVNNDENVRTVFTTTDTCNTWIAQGDIPIVPWSVGMYLSPQNPDFLITGGVECFYSTNGGIGWAKTNNWGDYYGDVEGSLHADMMYFESYETAQGEAFMLISNHGGLSVSYDEMATRQNLGLDKLFVSQYYDVRTDPLDPAYIYAGSQDQGFQRAYSFSPAQLPNFEQVISGDYGHIAFSENNQRLWTVYPGGWITYYQNPQSSYFTQSYDIVSENETVWIPPLVASPIAEENAVYAAGGSADGGPGSYLIKLNHTDIGTIEPEQVDFDFHDQSSGGTIASIAFSPINPNRWYVSTTNGRFFYSTDAGQSWDQTIQFVPEGHYLYGASIYPSALDENVVYFAGSGYSNPAVYKSTDGGEVFIPINSGMPSTLVFELAATPDESLLFAATEAGPYVYVTAEDLWYDMSGEAAPTQTYWSVEYVEAYETVRFGTYGRGIWDFNISESVNVETIAKVNTRLQLFPNPATDVVQLRLDGLENGAWQLDIFTSTGQNVQSQSIQHPGGDQWQQQIDIRELPQGTYTLRVTNGKQSLSEALIKL